jgi:hypothetical protein
MHFLPSIFQSVSATAEKKIKKDIKMLVETNNTHIFAPAKAMIP